MALICMHQATADDAYQKLLLEECRSSDAIVHIRVAATADPKNPRSYIVKSVWLVRTIKKADSFLGDAAVSYALTIVRPGDALPDWYEVIRAPADYVVFCRSIVGDVTLPSGPEINVTLLYKDDDSKILQLCDAAEAAKD